MKWMMLVAMAVAMGAAPATRPTTGPAMLDTKPIYAALATADSALAKAKADARAKWEASAEYRALKDDLDAKRTARDNAKAGTDLQTKLDTAKAYNDARRAFEAADAKGGMSDPDLVAALRERDAAARELADVERENAKRQAEADARDPIKVAMKAKRVIVGMTAEQVRQTLPNWVTSEEIQQDQDGKTLRYKIISEFDGGAFVSVSTYYLDVRYERGKAVSVEKSQTKTATRDLPTPVGRGAR